MKQVRVQDSKEAHAKSDSSVSHIGGAFMRSEKLLHVYQRSFCNYTEEIKNTRMKWNLNRNTSLYYSEEVREVFYSAPTGLC